MTKIVKLFVGVLLLSTLAFGQGNGYNAYRAFTTTATGTDVNIVENSLIGWHQISWVVTGSPATCTVKLQQSPDGSTWTDLIANQTCTSNGSSSISSQVLNTYVRLNVTAFSGGTNPSITTTYEGWAYNPGGGGGSGFTTAAEVVAAFTGCSGVEYLGADTACHTAGTGTVTSVGLSMPSWLTVTNSPVTTTGTLTAAPTTGQTSHQVIGTCGSNTTFAPCSLAATDIPTLNQNTTGNAGTVTGLSVTTGKTLTVSNSLTLAGTDSTTMTFPSSSDTVVTLGATQSLTHKTLTDSTNVFPTFNQNTTGSAAKWTTARNLAGNSVDGSAGVPFANAFVVGGTADSGLSGAQFLGALGNGLLVNATTSGTLSIATYSNIVSLFSSCSGTQLLGYDGNCHTVSGTGTVTSAGLSGDGTVLSSTVGSSPITTSGTMTLSLANAAAFSVLNNNTSSSAAPIYTNSPTVIGLNITPGGSNTASGFTAIGTTAPTLVTSTLGTTSNPWIQPTGAATNTGLYWPTTSSIGLTVAGTAVWQATNIGNTLQSSSLYSWTAGQATGTKDTTLARKAAGVVEVGSGSTAGTTGGIVASYYQSAGTKFTASGCSNSTTVGGATAGTFVSGTTGTCTVTITMGDSDTATNGWACAVNDETTANLMRETASNTTTATVSGTTVSSDVIVFECHAY